MTFFFVRCFVYVVVLVNLQEVKEDNPYIATTRSGMGKKKTGSTPM
jgi:hypothetical protein